MAGAATVQAVFLSTWVKFFSYLNGMRKFTALLTALLLAAAIHAQQTDPRLARATREDKNGWIHIHLEGSPRDIGFQHGYLLASEIDDLIRTLKYYLPHNSGKDWTFYRGAVKKMFWNK